MKGWLYGILCGALSALSAEASTDGFGVAFSANRSDDPTVGTARMFAADSVDGMLAVAVTTPGQDIWGMADSGSFYFFPEVGDCEVVATIPPLMQTGENAAIGNFAKAGILTIAQQNCSIDDVAPCPTVSDRTVAVVGNRR